MLTSSPLRGAVDMEKRDGEGGCSAPNCAGVTVGKPQLSREGVRGAD